MLKSTHVAMYGNTALQREWCNKCESWAIVLDGILQCCDMPSILIPRKYKRVCEPAQERKTPPAEEKNKILLEQDYKCYYCDKTFDTHNYRKGKQILLKIVWDHTLPWAYSQNNSTDNFVAACQICNGIKSDRIYKNLDEARIDIAETRIKKGYRF